MREKNVLLNKGKIHLFSWLERNIFLLNKISFKGENAFSFQKILKIVGRIFNQKKLSMKEIGLEIF